MPTHNYESSHEKKDWTEIDCFWVKQGKVSKAYAKEVIYRENNIVCKQCEGCKK
jgi:hypothetical protein